MYRATTPRLTFTTPVDQSLLDACSYAVGQIFDLPPVLGSQQDWQAICHQAVHAELILAVNVQLYVITGSQSCRVPSDDILRLIKM